MAICQGKTLYKAFRFSNLLTNKFNLCYYNKCVYKGGAFIMLNLYVRLKKFIQGKINYYNKSNFLIYIKSILLIIIFSELYFYPFDTIFRFSVGVIILNITILLYKQLSSLKLALTSGVIILIIRSLVSYIFLGQSFEFAIYSNLPTISFYIFYALLHNLFSKKISSYNSFVLMFIFATIDIISNSCETFIRGSVDYKVLKAIVFVGIIRSTISYLFFVLLNTPICPILLYD